MVASNIAVKVEIVATKGSAPREVGAVLWVFPDRIEGSIGGGNMENDAIAAARSMLPDGGCQNKTYTLGPKSGQCCGGIVQVQFSISEYEHSQRPLLAIFGAGHVGSVLARLARAIDIDVQLYDARSTVELPKPEPYIAIAIPEKAIENLPDGTSIVILTHDHGLDFLLADAALKENRFAFVGMIGSQSKAAQFRSAHKSLGKEKLNKLVSPIAKSSVDKRPESVAIDILQALLPNFAKY